AELLAVRAQIYGRPQQEVAACAALSARYPDDPALRLALAHSQLRASDYAAALTAAEAALELDPRDPQATLARAEALTYLERFDEAATALAEAEALYDRLGLLSGTARVAELRGDLEFSRGRLASAMEYYGAAAKLFQATGRPVRGARAEKARADVQLKLGDLTAAVATYRRIEPTFREAGFYAAVVEMLSSLGGALYLEGRLEDAERTLRAALDEARKLDNRALMLAPMLTLANLLGYSGRSAEARPLADEILELGRELRDREAPFFARTLLGSDALHTGDLARAQRIFRRMIHEADDAGSAEWRAYALVALAGTLLAAEKTGPALEALDEAIAINERLGLAVDLGYALALRGRVRAELGEAARAIEDLDRAEEIATQDETPLGDLEDTVRATRGWAALLEAQWERADEVLAPLVEPQREPPSASVAMTALIGNAYALSRLGRSDAAIALAERAASHEQAGALERLAGQLCLADIAARRAAVPTAPSSVEIEAQRVLERAVDWGLPLTRARAGALLLSHRAGRAPRTLRQHARDGLRDYLHEVPSERRAFVRRRWDVSAVEQVLNAEH
ncbi:MAG: tetratricopeptide repeat protein, partial [Acidobacteriota bacterium]